MSGVPNTPSGRLWNFGKPWWSDYDTERILAIWPELVRVVEAAEEAVRNAQLVCDEEIVLDKRIEELGRALAR